MAASPKVVRALQQLGSAPAADLVASYEKVIAEIRGGGAAATVAGDLKAVFDAVLAEIPLDSPQRRVGAAERARVWIRIVRNYLEDDETATAEVYLNKLKPIMHQLSPPSYSEAPVSAASSSDGANKEKAEGATD